MVAHILVEIKAKQLDQTFTYLIPSHLEHKIKIGMRVLVPFASRNLEGFVLDITETIDSKHYALKEIISVIDEAPVLTQEMIKLGHYIQKKTMSTLISAYQTMLPTALKAKHGTNIQKKYETYLQLKDVDYVTTGKQKEIIDLLQKQKYVLKRICNQISVSAVKTLLKHQVIEELTEEVYRLKEDVEQKKCQLQLNQAQQSAVNKILTSIHKFTPFLLHGVTGSGKTEVYMHVIKEILNQGKEAIVLVPEISLTPQLVDHFKKRFGNQIAILHSRLSNGEKYDEWRKIERKEVSIVIGARSAVFAPFQNLGLIIIDEEHTDTYKQENNPRYHAIDIALYRAKYHQCPLVLGSATPSIESYTRAKAGIYTLIELKERVNQHLPATILVDMKEEIKQGNTVLSRALKQEIEHCLARGEQAILLLNRRGYTTISTCNQCGFTDKCPNCDIPLTYHKATNSMKCHYCNYSHGKLLICPDCGSKDIHGFGMGTEKLEQIVAEELPQARILRMDIDTTRRKGAHESMIRSFQNGEYNLLIGTQMIAKGLDFPKVTVVGVLNGDATLNIPDFRSAERTFDLLNQVAGRAGRANLNGKVIIQGFNISHYSIVYASKHDYQHFYEEELKIRKQLNYPPFYNLCLIRIKGSNYEACMKESNKISTYLKQHQTSDMMLLGPSNASIPKINNIYYMQIIMKFKKTNILMPSLMFLQEYYKSNHKVNVEIDLNPIRI